MIISSQSAEHQDKVIPCPSAFKFACGYHKIFQILFALIFLFLHYPAEAENHLNPSPIIKLGTIDVDVVEASLFTFNGELFRLYWNRSEKNLQISNHLTKQKISTFGSGHGFPSSIVYGDTIYVVGTRIGKLGGDALTLFSSKDMLNWSEKIIFDNVDNFSIFNTSLTKDDDGFTMSMEINQTSKTDPPKSFAARFLKSTDLNQWYLLPRNYNHGYDRYTAPHALRYLDGTYYLFYLELKAQDAKTGLPTLFEQNITRSQDLKKWQDSKLNPVLTPSTDDKIIFNKYMDRKDIHSIKHALNINNSDIEFVYYKNKLVILYSWGNQRGVEFLAEAEFDGSESNFLKGFFPLPSIPGINE